MLKTQAKDGVVALLSVFDFCCCLRIPTADRYLYCKCIFVACVHEHSPATAPAAKESL